MTGYSDMSKLRLAVIFGGASSEHEVSLMSAASVFSNLSGDKYEVLPVGITKKGQWLYYPGSIDDISSGKWEKNPDCVPAVISPDRAVGGLILMPPGKDLLVRKVDVVFPMLHGKYGEDGTIQGLIELAGIPCVGAGTLSSAVCMDKEVANSLFDGAGIPRAPWGVIRLRDIERFDDYADEWEKKFGYPMFIKPANAGSSVGVSKVGGRSSLREAVNLAFTHDRKVIAEKAVAGKELECAVLGNDNPFASEISEILPTNEFYDYDAKYSTPSETILPADISHKLRDSIKKTAVRAYGLLECSGMARVDFLYEVSTDILFINEINTIPGFTSISMYAKMMDASGINYPRLLEKLIDLALEKHASIY